MLRGSCPGGLARWSASTAKAATVFRREPILDLKEQVSAETRSQHSSVGVG